MSKPANSEIEAFVNTHSTATLKTLIQEELKDNTLQRHLQDLSTTEVESYKLNLNKLVEARINPLNLERMPENNKIPSLQQFKNSRDQDPIQWLELFNSLGILAKWSAEEKAQEFPFYWGGEASN